MQSAAINKVFDFLPRKNCAVGDLWLFVEQMADAMKSMLCCLLLVLFCIGSASSHANNPPQGRLVASFSYNAEGLRIEKQGERGIERYTYDDQSVLSQRDGNNQLIAHYSYGPNRLIALEHNTEGTQFYLTDALNSIANLMNSNGLVQARYQYDAFGNKRSESGSSWNRFAFTGYEEDKETNLLYAKARYYDADTARFLSQDAWTGDNNTPPSLHKYLYAYQNPTVWIDPTGNNPVSPMDWASFAHDVGGLLVQEGIYVAAKINSNEAVADLALEGMKEARMDAAMSTAGIFNPVPGTSSIYKTSKIVKKGEEAFEAARMAEKANDARKVADKANDIRRAEDQANGVRKLEKSADELPNAKITKESKSAPGSKNQEVEMLGGAHRDMKNPVNDGLDSHHMPAKDSYRNKIYSETDYKVLDPNDGPAVKVKPDTHRKTSSHGSGDDAIEYRENIAKKLEDGRWRDAMADEIKDLRRAAKEVEGDRTVYNNGIRQMLEYSKDKRLLDKK